MIMQLNSIIAILIRFYLEYYFNLNSMWDTNICILGVTKEFLQTFRRRMTALTTPTPTLVLTGLKLLKGLALAELPGRWLPLEHLGEMAGLSGLLVS